MTLYHNDGHCKFTFRASSTPQEEDTTTIKVRMYRSDFPDLYADARRCVVEFVPLDESGRQHGVSLEIIGSVGELESLFSRAIRAIHDTGAEAGDSAEYTEKTFKAPAEIVRQDAKKEKAHA